MKLLLLSLASVAIAQSCVLLKKEDRFDNTFCEQTGTLDSDYPSTVYDVPTFRDCRNSAINRGPEYASFSYDATTKLCTLYKYSLYAGTFTPGPGTGANFSDVYCYKCSSWCGVPVSNVLANADFQRSSSDYLGPWEPSGGFGYVPGYNSARAAGVSTTANQGNYNAITQNFNYCTDATYFLRYDSRFSFTIDPDSNATEPRQYARTTITSYEFERQTSFGWSRIEGYFNIRPSRAGLASGYIRHEFQSQAELDAAVDNVRIFPVKRIAPLASAGEKLGNGGFDTGSLSPWTPIDTAAVRAFNGSSRLTTNTRERFGVSQTISTTVGKHYLLKFDYIAEYDTTDVPWYIDVFRFTIGNRGTVSGQGDVTTRGTLPRGNGTYQLPIVARTTSTVLDLNFEPTCISAGTCELFIDNISLKELDRSAAGTR